MSSEEQERTAKQTFLRTQIIDGGYDPDDFVDYINSKVSTGADVDLISFDQLKEIVTGFKQMMTHRISSQGPAMHQAVNVIEEKSLVENLEVINATGSSKIKPKFVIFEKYGPPPPQEQEMEKTFKCMKFTPKMQLVANPKIEVSDPQRKSTGGLFGIGATSFLLFKIQTFDYKWEVRRRYSDFQWLRLTLCRFFPTHMVNNHITTLKLRSQIPPLPKKKAHKRTQRDLDKRMRILTYFLNDIASVPEIFHSKFVTGFMSMSSDSQFEELKKQYNKREAFETITSLETKNGEVTVRLDNDHKVYNDQIEKFLNNAEVIYKEITRNSKMLQNTFIEETNTLYRIGNLFADLQGSLQEFNNKLPMFQQTPLNDTYITLNNMMVEWGNIVRNQHAYLEKNFNTFFKYIRNEVSSFRELQKKMTDLEVEYFKNKMLLDKKKERIFSLNDISKWEIPSAEVSSIPPSVVKNKYEAMKLMLPRESFEMEKQKIKYAFYSSQFFEQSSETLAKGSNRFCENFKEFAIKIKVNNQQLTELWSEIATNFADPKKKLAVQVQQMVQTHEKEEVYDD